MASKDEINEALDTLEDLQDKRGDQKLEPIIDRLYDELEEIERKRGRRERRRA